MGLLNLITTRLKAPLRSDMAYRTENAMAFAPGVIFGCLDGGGMLIDRDTGEYLPCEQVIRDPLHIDLLDFLHEDHLGPLKGTMWDEDDEGEADDEEDRFDDEGDDFEKVDCYFETADVPRGKYAEFCCMNAHEQYVFLEAQQIFFAKLIGALDWLPSLEFVMDYIQDELTIDVLLVRLHEEYHRDCQSNVASDEDDDPLDHFDYLRASRGTRLLIRFGMPRQQLRMVE